jgi:hypothetical protein
MTLFGGVTRGDVADLIANKDAVLAELHRAWFELAASWAARDPGAEAAFALQLAALDDRYAQAKALFSNESLGIPPGTVWNAVLVALKQKYDPDTGMGPVSPGDLADLSARLQAVGGKPDYSAAPQPQSPDWDMRMYKATDIATRGMKLGFGWGIGALLLLLLLRKD